MDPVEIAQVIVGKILGVVPRDPKPKHQQHLQHQLLPGDPKPKHLQHQHHHQLTQQ